MVIFGSSESAPLLPYQAPHDKSIIIPEQTAPDNRMDWKFEVAYSTTKNDFYGSCTQGKGQMTPRLLLFTVIVLEGYIVLSTELLAIRQVIPYVGTGTDVVSIIITAVLLPLALGYYTGGQFKPGFQSEKYISLRKKLTRNILMSGIILFFGLSGLFIDMFFVNLLDAGIASRVIMITLYAAAFLVIPVFLLGQTVPLISNFFSKQELSKITGKMLFFSTLGSCLGATLSTLILMNFVGVNNTVNVLFLLLSVLIFLLSKQKFKQPAMSMYVLTLLALLVNSNTILRGNNIVENNAYNTIQIIDAPDGRHMIMNGNDSSRIGKKGEKHPYIEFVETHFIEPIATTKGPPKEILVVGSAGFSVGLEDTKNTYTFVDIDTSVRKVAEWYFLKRKLGPNKHFVGEDIRSYLRHNKKNFDLVFLDAYLGNLTLPESLVTQEYFQYIRNVMKPDGFMVANFIVSPTFADRFSQNIDNTLRHVFPHVTRQVLDDRYNAWDQKESSVRNVMYVYRNDKNASTRRIYTDNLNPVAFDKPRKNPMARGTNN